MGSTILAHDPGAERGAKEIKMSIFKSPTVWSGNTYTIRDAIRRLGGKWDAQRKVWIVPALTMKERSNVYSACGGLRGVTVERA